MKLVRLSLHHFRQHLDTCIDFLDGITGLIGPNGSGKTTIVESLCFALYGARALRGRTEDLKPRSIRGEAKPSVELLFEHDGGTYRLERGLLDAKLYLGGEDKPLASGNREVTHRVIALLGMSHEEFVAAYFTEQNGLEFLGGKSGASERERFIVRMLGYDRLEKIQELLREDRRDKKQELIGLESGLGSREEIESEISKYTDELGLLEALEKEASVALKQAEKETANLKECLTKFQEKRVAFLKERENLGLLQVRYSEKVKRTKFLDQEKKGLLGEVNKSETIQLGLKKSSLEEYRQKAKEDLKVVGEKLNKIREELSSVMKQRDEERISLGRDRENYEVRYRELSSRKTELEELGSKGDCPTCGQELGTTFESVKSRVEKERRSLQKELDGINAKISKVDTDTEEILTYRKQLLKLNEEREGKQKLLEEISSFERQFGALSRVESELETHREELLGLDSELKSLRDKIAGMQFVEEEFLKVQGGYEAAQRLIEISRLKKVKLQGEIGTKLALRDRTKAALMQYDQKVLYLNQQKEKALLFEEGDKLLTEFRRYINSGIRPRLSEIASEFITDLTDGRYTTVEIGEDFVPTVVEDGEPKPVISGGEEDILNLCLRLSLSQMLTERSGAPFSLLILDEVFGSLDEGRRANVLSLLEKLRHRFEQTLIITHLDDINEGVEHLMTVQYDEGLGVSTIENAFLEQELAFNL